MKKIIPIIIVLSTIFAANKGIEYWKENSQPLLEDYQVVEKTKENPVDKPKTTLEKNIEEVKPEHFPENVIRYFTEQYMNLFESPVVELTAVSPELAMVANDMANRMALACPVMPIPTITFTDANASSTAAGCSISLTAAGCGSNSVRWYRNGVYDEVGSTFTDYPYVNTNYYAECWDGASCTSTQSNMIQVPVWQVRVTPQSATTVCPGSTATLTAEIYNASSTPFPSIATYQWQLYGNNIPSATNQTYNAGTSGSYNVVVKFPFPSACTSYAYSSQVNVLPITTISASGPTDVCPGNSVNMYWNSVYEYYQGGGGPTFQWKKDGVNISGANSQYFKATQGPGAYTLTITKSNCSVTTEAINVTNSGTAPTEIPTITGPGTTTSPFVTCYEGDGLRATGCGAGQSVYWSEGSTSTAIFVSVNTNYYANCGTSATCKGPTSSNAMIINPKVEIVKTVGPTDCDATVLTASSTPISNVVFQWALFDWNTFQYNDISGATSNQYQTTVEGSYRVIANYSGLSGGSCSSSYYSSTTSSPAVTTPTIKACNGVNPSVCTELASPVTLFSGTSITLQASNCNASITWSNGATGSSLVVSATGVYTATCSNGTCTSPNSNAIQVTVNPCNTSVSLSHPANDITNNPTANGTLWQASAINGLITASNWINGVGTKATYEAKSIVLSPGFIADLGTTFKASTGGCN